jgi:hypothetical protein
VAVVAAEVSVEAMVAVYEALTDPVVVDMMVAAITMPVVTFATVVAASIGELV